MFFKMWKNKILKKIKTYKTKLRGYNINIK